MNRVKMNAKQEYEYLANFKVLQTTFKNKKIDKVRASYGLREREREREKSDERCVCTVQPIPVPSCSILVRFVWSSSLHHCSNSVRDSPIFYSLSLLLLEWWCGWRGSGGEGGTRRVWDAARAVTRWDGIILVAEFESRVGALEAGHFEVERIWGGWDASGELFDTYTSADVCFEFFNASSRTPVSNSSSIHRPPFVSTQRMRV